MTRMYFCSVSDLQESPSSRELWATEVLCGLWLILDKLKSRREQMWAAPLPNTNKVPGGGFDEALESSHQASVTVKSLYRRKNLKFGSFLNSGKFNGKRKFHRMIIEWPKVMITNDWVNWSTLPHLSSYKCLIRSLIRIRGSSWLMTFVD